MNYEKKRYYLDYRLNIWSILIGSLLLGSFIKIKQPNKTMKRVSFLAFLFAFLTIGAKSQILTPVTWSYAAKKTSATTATIFLKATIEDGWHLYSQFIKDGGPVKTTFTIPNGKGYTVLGKTIEPKAIVKYEDMFKMQIGYFEKSVVFQQKVKLTGKTAVVKGKVEYMVCNDQQCLPPDETSFSIVIK